MFQVTIVALTLLVATTEASFKKSIFSHYPAVGKASEWNCQLGTHEAFEGDEAPNVVLLTHSEMPRADCAGKCTDGPTELSNVSADTAYCAKDVNGVCARALVIASFSEKPKSCTPSFHVTQAGDRHFKVDLEFDTMPAKFEGEVRRFFDSDYTCAKAMDQKCTVVGSCGGYHIAVNTREPVNGQCTTECVATPNVCDLMVCHKVDDKCMVSDRLMSGVSGDDTTNCVNNPPVCDGPEADLAFHAYVRYNPFMAKAETTSSYCCAGNGIMGTTPVGAKITHPPAMTGSGAGGTTGVAQDTTNDGGATTNVDGPKDTTDGASASSVSLAFGVLIVIVSMLF